MTLIGAVLLAGPATIPADAHPIDTRGSRCPCISVTGHGSRSASFALSRPTTVYQNDISPEPDGSTVTGWVLEDSRGSIVAGRVFVASGVVYSHSIDELGSVTLAPGRYTITRLSQSSHRIDIPVDGSTGFRINATASPRVKAAYTLGLGAAAAQTALTLDRRSRYLFAEARQDSSAGVYLVSCVDDTCTRNSDVGGDPNDPSFRLMRTTATAVSVRLTAGASSARAVGFGAGTGTRVLQLVLSVA